MGRQRQQVGECLDKLAALFKKKWPASSPSSKKKVEGAPDAAKCELQPYAINVCKHFPHWRQKIGTEGGRQGVREKGGRMRENRRARRRGRRIWPSGSVGGTRGVRRGDPWGLRGVRESTGGQESMIDDRRAAKRRAGG